MDKIQLVVAVIAVTLGNRRIHTLQCALYDIVHLLDLDLILSKRICMFLRELADKFLLFI